MRQIIWQGNSREEIRGFPIQARKEAGRQLLRIQLGLEPADWRPMRTIGIGVREIRIHYEGQYRVIYVAMRQDTVFVLHAFHKKTRNTAMRHIELAKQRLREVHQ